MYRLKASLTTGCAMILLQVSSGQTAQAGTVQMRWVAITLSCSGALDMIKSVIHESDSVYVYHQQK